MKIFSLLTMGLGFLATLSSTLFAIISRGYDALLILLFWALLTAFEIFALRIWLISKTAVRPYTQRLVLLSLIGLILAWIGIVLNNPDAQLIFLWALRTLNNSGLFFIGLIIYGYTKKTSNKSK